jgi:hypothetical protein
VHAEGLELNPKASAINKISWETLVEGVIGKVETALPMVHTFNTIARRDLWRSSPAIPKREGDLRRPSPAILTC